MIKDVDVLTNVRKIGQWDRFEHTVNHTKEYADSYREVQIDVKYTKPDGSQIDFWGFYDGDSTWKFRCLPDQIGIWKFEAAFTDGSGLYSGEFECVPSDIPGQIHVDESNPIW